MGAGFVTVDSQLESYRPLHETTEGWFSWESAAIWDSLLRFQARSGVTGPLLEIGVYRGLAAGLLLLHAAEGEPVLLVDSHLDRGKVRRAFRKLPRAVRKAAVEIKSNSKDLRAVERVTVERGRYRWIHIDGEHSSAMLRNDLEIADEMIGDEGIICIDDIFGVLYPHLTETLFQMTRARPDRYRIFLVGHNKAYLVRPPLLRRHLDHCHDQLLDDLEEAGVLAALGKKSTDEEFPGFSIYNRRPEQPRLVGHDHYPDRFEY